MLFNGENKTQSRTKGVTLDLVMSPSLIHFTCRLTESLKNGNLENSLRELQLDKGTGDNGELSDDELDKPLTYNEDQDCRQIVKDVRKANESLEAAIPGI